MTDRELMQQALEALNHVNVQDRVQIITALRERLAQPEQEPVAHSIVAGALFDFMGWLTSRKERLVLSSSAEASPAVEAIQEFAKMRGLSLADADVQNWQQALASQQPREWVGLTDEECIAAIDEDFNFALDHGNVSDRSVIRYARAIEAKLREKNS